MPTEILLLRRLAVAVGETVHREAYTTSEIATAYAEYARNYPDELKQLVDGRVVPADDGSYRLEWFGQLCRPAFDTVEEAHAYRYMLRNGHKMPEYVR